ncbi:hypothetical protein [Clostridium sp. Marseille-Q7071]
MKRFKFSKGIFLMLTLVLTLSLIPSKITYAVPTCCDRFSPGWERRGTDRERSSHKINCRTHNVVHYCEITETYRNYRKICLAVIPIWEKRTEFWNQQHILLKHAINYKQKN